jgi:lactoylglutathione lyase
MRLAHTMIRVKDLEETLAFYTGLLGLREVRRKPIGDEATLVFLTDEDGHYHIELTYNHGRDAYDLGDQFGHLALTTPDLEAVVREVEARGMWYRRSRPESKVARPRNEKNPTMSVTVVRMIEDDCAGSCPSAVRTIGVAAPENPAATIETIIDRPITSARPIERLQTSTARDVVNATAQPLISPTFASFQQTRSH